MKEYYKILGLERGASIEEVREAKNALLLMWHPDFYQRNPEFAQAAEEKTKLINDAYDKIIRYIETGEEPLSRPKPSSSGNKRHADTQAEYERNRAEQERIAKERAAERERLERERVEQERIRQEYKKRVNKVFLVCLVSVLIIPLLLLSIFLTSRDKVQSIPISEDEVRSVKTQAPYNQSDIDELTGSSTFAGVWRGNLSGLPFELQIWEHDDKWEATISFRAAPVTLAAPETLIVIGRKRKPETFYLYRPADVAYISMFNVNGVMNFAYVDSGTVRNVTLKKIR